MKKINRPKDRWDNILDIFLSDRFKKSNNDEIIKKKSMAKKWRLFDH